MGKNSFMAGLLGAVGIIVGLWVVLLSLGVLFGSTLAWLVFNSEIFALISTGALISLVVGVLVTAYSVKTVVQNENELVRMIIGITGLCVAGSGLLLASLTIASIVGAVLALAVALFGLALFDWGFKTNTVRKFMSIEKFVRIMPL